MPLYPAGSRAEQDSSGLYLGCSLAGVMGPTGIRDRRGPPYLHGAGVHVGEHLFPGQRILVISKCFGQAFLQIKPRKLYENGQAWEEAWGSLLLTIWSLVWGGWRGVLRLWAQPLVDDYLHGASAVVHSLCHVMGLRSSMLTQKASSLG